MRDFVCEVFIIFIKAGEKGVLFPYENSKI